MLLAEHAPAAVKTLSAFKAFRDCFLPVSDVQSVPTGTRERPAHLPPLAGYLPLWLPLDDADTPRATVEKELDRADGAEREKMDADPPRHLLNRLMLVRPACRNRPGTSSIPGPRTVRRFCSSPISMRPTKKQPAFNCPTLCTTGKSDSEKANATGPP